MKNQNIQTWVDETDLLVDSKQLNQEGSEFNPVSVESILEDEKSGHLETNRRDFLKLLGFGVGAATLASCEAPIKKAIPYTIRPDEIVPGIANYYASTFVNGGDVCPVLVKTREGRPIKIEGNALSSFTKGGTSARVQASVLSLYDYNRTQNPSKLVADGKIESISWDELDTAVKAGLSGSRVRILSSTVMSPSAKKAIQEFCVKYPNAKHVTYDAISYSALLDASQKCFGERVLPNYKFDHADVIVSFNADFLGTWISPIEYANQYASKRKLDSTTSSMSKHIQVESRMSLTGSNADNRILVRPSEQGAAIVTLYNAVASKTGANTVAGIELNGAAKTKLSKLAETLVAAKGKSLIVCGTNNIAEQILVFGLNNILGNIGVTVDFSKASFQRQGNDIEFQALVKEMQGNGVDALIVWNANPAYDSVLAKEFAIAAANVKLKVSLNQSLDETSLLCNFLAPDHHYLESWGDVEAKRGSYSLIQPTISPLFNTRQAPLSLLLWADSTSIIKSSEQPYYDFVKANWQSSIFTKATNKGWDKTLHDGNFEANVIVGSVNFIGNVTEAADKVSKPNTSGIDIEFFESHSIGAGQYANNPWLMELPDPISRCVWGNYLTVSVKFDGDRRFLVSNGVEENGEELVLTIDGTKTTLGAIKQFGQLEGTSAIALGYGRKNAGDCGTEVGTDMFPFCRMDSNGYVQYYASNAELSNSTGTIEKNFACVQHHHTLGVTGIEKSSGKKINADEAELVDDFFKPVAKGFQGSLTKRSVIRQANFKDLKQSVEHLHEERAEFQKLNSHTLYPGHDYKYNSGHHWGMHVDLNSCIGCGTCAVACMAENNVPVVGKKEVSRHHEMTWLRIDRYYYGDTENPNVVYQPLMCQHCNNAPCENVCPVNATNHSADGLNQMAYNRCVGTRYCANNCPYKVRRFNWYDYTSADLFPVNQKNLNKETDKPFYADNIVRMVLNPDVTVRSRGVIEKCSFCIQRIQEGKLNAKKEQRALTDHDVKTACQSACPTGAITFGDMNNENGNLSKKLKNPLNYIVLEEINVKSAVTYTMKVNNRDESLDA
ncbi:MAG: 4Fe-4S dicluster domain-containing protein [Saprospiraceae bacterium]|nr:4Fe-4S dicluster domain-containing protein [Saprospiraceae bacterium]